VREGAFPVFVHLGIHGFSHGAPEHLRLETFSLELDQHVERLVSSWVLVGSDGKRAGPTLIRIRHGKPVDLLQVVLTLYFIGFPAALEKGRNKKARYDGYDGDHNQKLDQREPMPRGWVLDHRYSFQVLLRALGGSVPGTLAFQNASLTLALESTGPGKQWA